MTLIRPARREDWIRSAKQLVLVLRGGFFVGRRHQCPCCGRSLRAFVGRWGFVRPSPDGYCPRCNAKARHRRAWLYLRDQIPPDGEQPRLLDIAPWSSLARCARRSGLVDYVGLDLAPTGPQVDVVGDVTSIPSPTDGFDIVVCVHVLEHVDDDRAAIAEIHRALRPGGFALVSVPLTDAGPTREDPTITSEEDRLREFGERTHVRLYGMDIEDRLRAAGFDVRVDLATEMPQPTRRRHGLRDDDHLFHCSKAD